VFVNSSAIVPASGLLSTRDYKVSSNFNRVTEMRSDLTSHSEQLQVNVSPFNWSYNWRWNLGYMLQNTQDEARGFSSTAGDPREKSWARAGTDSRHTVSVGFNYLFFGALGVNWSQQFRSGTPYTPMIAGDVNGDGYLNDRAFVFDPASTSDVAVKSGMETLLASGPSAARDCLRSQLGKLAGRATCQGPWTTNAQLSINLDPVRTHLPHRMGISFNITNPLGAVDMLVHGQDDMHGWGQSPLPDNTLLSVRGFDPSTNRYNYEVNQRFGSTSLQQTLSRNPVRIQMSARFDVGPTTERQLLTQQLDRGRSMAGMPKVNEQMWKQRYSGGPVINPLAQILTQADSLQLTRVQADSIASLNRWYTIRLDSIWTPIAKYLADMPVTYDQSEAYAKYREGREASVDLLIKIAPTVRAMMTPAQTRKLGSFISQYLDSRFLAYVRSGTASGGSGSFGGPVGAEMMAVSAMAGGGGSFVIIR
jgi:hypothetical protein